MGKQRTRVRRRISIIVKATVAIVLTSVVVMAIGSYLMYRGQARLSTDQMKQEAGILAAALELSVSKNMEDNSSNRQYMQKITEELGKIVGVEAISIHGLDLITIASTEMEEVGEREGEGDIEDTQEVLRTGKAVATTEIKGGEEIYSKTIPIYVEKEGKEQMVAVAEVSMSLAEIAKLLTIKEQADVLATIVGLNLQNVTEDNLANQEYTQKLTEDLGRQGEVDQIQIYDTTRRVIADTDRNELGQIATGEHAEHLREALETGQTITCSEEKEGKEVYSMTLPIYAKIREKEELAGVLEVSMSVPYYIQSLIIPARNGIILLTILIVFAISVITILLLRRSVVSPILSLAGMTKVIAEGDLSKRAEIKSNDEIGELAASFNHMTDEMQKRDEELQTMNEELRSTNEELETAGEELSRTQEELIQKEKLAAVGQLASGVGHELRNPLGVIKNAVYYINSKLPEDPKLQKHIAIMEKEIANSNKIISDLLGFSRAMPPAISSQDINKVVEDTMEVVEIPKNVKLVRKLGTDLPNAMADPDQIRQVFVNLSLNAIQAMSEGGQLGIATRRKDSFIEVEFADTGCGIPEENLKKLFDPFFTTRPRGIGLGLAVTQGIIERHNGSIEVESEVEKGTTFIVKLPVETKGV